MLPYLDKPYLEWGQRSQSRLADKEIMSASAPASASVDEDNTSSSSSSYDCDIETIDIYELRTSMTLDGRTEDSRSVTEELVSAGCIANVPFKPSAVVSVDTLELYRCPSHQKPLSVSRLLQGSQVVSMGFVDVSLPCPKPPCTHAHSVCLSPFRLLSQSDTGQAT